MNSLLIHVLQKSVSEKAYYEKVVRGLEEHDRIEVVVAIELFEHEARDFTTGNINEFYRSPAFLKDYRIEGRNIKTLNKV